MIDGDKVIVDNRIFTYCAFYDRLEAKDNRSPGIACPRCKNTLFTISYGSYECIANCKCGHSMIIYDG